MKTCEIILETYQYSEKVMESLIVLFMWKRNPIPDIISDKIFNSGFFPINYVILESSYGTGKSALGSYKVEHPQYCKLSLVLCEKTLWIADT